MALGVKLQPDNPAHRTLLGMSPRKDPTGYACHITLDTYIQLTLNTHIRAPHTYMLHNSQHKHAVPFFKVSSSERRHNVTAGPYITHHTSHNTLTLKLQWCPQSHHTSGMSYHTWHITHNTRQLSQHSIESTPCVCMCVDTVASGRRV